MARETDNGIEPVPPCCDIDPYGGDCDIEGFDG